MGFLTISLACTALGLALATPLSAQALNEAEMIRRVEQLSVSRLDSTLAEQPFAAWFRSTVGAAARIEYEVDDCGEQTGNPAVDAGRDFPACVSAYADLADGRQVGVSVVAGTLKQGLVGEPQLWMVFVRCGDRFSDVRRLGDLRAALRQPTPPGARCRKP